MIIAKIFLTLIAIFLSGKSLKFFLRYRTPMSFSMIILGVIILVVSWFDEVTTLPSFQQFKLIQEINLNFIIIATLISFLFFYLWLKLTRTFNKTQSEITNLTRTIALERSRKIE